jgi:hypothetical protein
VRSASFAPSSYRRRVDALHLLVPPSIHIMHPRTSGHVLLLFVTTLSCNERAMPTDTFGLDCIFDTRTSVTNCADVSTRRKLDLPRLRDAKQLELRRVTALRSASTLTLDIELQGRFDNDIDQNVYVFVGARSTIPSAYALTSDPQYFADLSYPVRGSLALPHTTDVRVGIMAPVSRTYTPQVYLRDPVHADLVGADAGIVQQVQGHIVHLQIPIERYFVHKGSSLPDALSVTVATARDYVGFIDLMTVHDLTVGASKSVTERPDEPASYPIARCPISRLGGDCARRECRRDGCGSADGGADTRLGTNQPTLLLFPVPPSRSSTTLRDPSGALQLPYKWSYYCAVYSPHRIFCKPSKGIDFKFDTAYAERRALEAPEGVRFREIGGATYRLEMPRQMETTLRAKRATFAVMVEVGRDGFGPTCWYGASEAH